MIPPRAARAKALFGKARIESYKGDHRSMSEYWIPALRELAFFDSLSTVSEEEVSRLWPWYEHNMGTDAVYVEMMLHWADEQNDRRAYQKAKSQAQSMMRLKDSLRLLHGRSRMFLATACQGLNEHKEAGDAWTLALPWAQTCGRDPYISALSSALAGYALCDNDERTITTAETMLALGSIEGPKRCAVGLASQACAGFCHWSRVIEVLERIRETDWSPKSESAAVLRGMRECRAKPEVAQRDRPSNKRMCRVCLKFGTADGSNGTLKILQFSGCELVYYYSAACQRGDWKQHKPSCRKVDVDSCCKCCWIEHATKSCGKCKEVKYCNSDCEKAHWEKHKNECGKQ